MVRAGRRGRLAVRHAPLARRRPLRVAVAGRGSLRVCWGRVGRVRRGRVALSGGRALRRSLVRVPLRGAPRRRMTRSGPLR
ncbi:hypothetical protein GCM10014719_60020 [Planomonospora parontospora subsp. antibiotica]|nr:hypothetical protein GCM10014719_60020 [Planomonospora parontospora subsp. antibiotica]GII19062.1 hypothetical protein Ppa05_57880 [Planomonospora parontospora subsp. antibiotica]